MIDKNSITLIIADDHPLLLKGLYEEFTRNNYNVLGQGKNGTEALQLILAHEPDIAFLDIDMPYLTGFEVIKTAKEKGVKTKFIVLSFHKEQEYISQAKALQINGYLLKEDSFFEIERCMENVLKGEYCFSRSFEADLLKSASDDIKNLQLLTPSESTILKMVSQNKSSHEIAEALFISIRTVEKHRSNIINKLKLDPNNNTLTSWALSNKAVIQKL
ncbi:response regulator [Aequorivita echinoideorum]|uniref:Response regulator transcription factor n=1 Tax=Aequorivita echinoideorum TaxID=1549647 RepID=A0ABS5S1R2_9FLAO|nr:response regulator transcription factor [Aequorivita echinoideorum]MBT0606918.1 response regulator transcription factor [Aequorivita echinoideorum]